MTTAGVIYCVFIFTMCILAGINTIKFAVIYKSKFWSFISVLPLGLAVMMISILMMDTFDKAMIKYTNDNNAPIEESIKTEEVL